MFIFSEFVTFIFFLLQRFFWGRNLRSGKKFCNWKHLKKDQKYFLFHLKAIFIFKILKYHVEKLLDEKDKTNFKIYDVWIGKQIITTHTLPYISRSEDNQTVKFGELIEYNVWNTFLENPSWKCGEETSSRLFF